MNTKHNGKSSEASVTKSFQKVHWKPN